LAPGRENVDLVILRTIPTDPDAIAFEGPFGDHDEAA
jgi:hypothetical protein